MHLHRETSYTLYLVLVFVISILIYVQFPVVWVTSVGMLCLTSPKKNAFAATAADGQAATSLLSQENDIDHAIHPYSISTI
jgi:hypothetical protein